MRPAGEKCRGCHGREADIARLTSERDAALASDKESMEMYRRCRESRDAALAEVADLKQRLDDVHDLYRRRAEQVRSTAESALSEALAALRDARSWVDESASESDSVEWIDSREALLRAYDAGRARERADVVAWLQAGGDSVFTESVVTVQRVGVLVQNVATPAEVPQLGLNALSYAIENGAHQREGGKP